MHSLFTLPDLLTYTVEFTHLFTRMSTLARGSRKILVAMVL